jgi:hypothetical protein
MKGAMVSVVPIEVGEGSDVADDGVADIVTVIVVESSSRSSLSPFPPSSLPADAVGVGAVAFAGAGVIIGAKAEVAPG